MTLSPLPQLETGRASHGGGGYFIAGGYARRAASSARSPCKSIRCDEIDGVMLHSRGTTCQLAPETGREILCHTDQSSMSVPSPANFCRMAVGTRVEIACGVTRRTLAADMRPLTNRKEDND
jgi:hypothetical protein